MEQKRTTAFANGLIWFGAAVSMAEILTGTYLAPLGFHKGLLAILLGHLIGGVLMFLAGYIGGKTRKSAMETAKGSFGTKGGLWFALLNVIQLVGWTGIMIYDGALAANGILSFGHITWCLMIGVLLILWLTVGSARLEKLNGVAVAALFLLTVVLSVSVFQNRSVLPQSSEALSFGAAVELSVAMPLSWLPLIGDYTKDAQKPLKASAVSAVVYGTVSCWMYLIGMGLALLVGETDLAGVMVQSGMGVLGLLIVVLSTVTTTYLDAASAGYSAKAIFPKWNKTTVAVITTVIGVLGAMFLPLYDITDFLYFIGSVFAPMIAIFIGDFYLLKKEEAKGAFCLKNLFIWLAGFVVYRLLMRVDFFLGSTLLDILFTLLLSAVVGFGEKHFQNRRQTIGKI